MLSGRGGGEREGDGVRGRGIGRMRVRETEGGKEKGEKMKGGRERKRE